ncbi:hypothetical protein [Bathymodiolus japonicus methanotrophic gill symbiont]|uniref:hypothetical protein n=1 Tax=Bathymodiolus japonicus methanotrophic gill symbiont TaxID=113269 RepID=UPI001C8EA05B|nr:hypothetical protein [Bathymodiolus japonicus methanotrophic gill symbiont]
MNIRSGLLRFLCLVTNGTQRHQEIPVLRDHIEKQNSGESLFLRKLVLGIPAQASGKNLTRPLMPPAAPIRPRHLVPTQQGVGT